MTLDDLKRVQEIDTELLCALDEVCKKHQIEYFLIDGTLLGCIRHGGPIPWDDDVDVAMTRENYEKFVEVAMADFEKAKYNVKIMGSGSIDYITEIKIGKVGTTYCLPGTEHLDIMNNVQLDIFCVDSAKKMTKQQLLRRLKLWNVLRIIALNKSEKKLLKLLVDKRVNSFKGAIYKSLLDFMHLIRIIVGERRIEKWGFEMFVDESNQSDEYTVAGYINVWKKEWFNIINHDYEGKKFPIPAGYDNILRTEYGDYMSFPKEEDRYKKDFEEWLFKEDNRIS